MVVGRLRDIDRHAPGIVVVGNLRRAAPLHIHPGMLDNGLPGKGHLADHHGRHVARALADLERRDVVRRVEQLAKCHGAGHAPHTARSQHGEQRFPTVALFDIVELLAHGRECLVPCDAHPARVLTLGIGSLHGIAKAIRVIRRLQRRLRFRAAVRHRLERRLVPLDCHRAAVPHGHPHAAFHLAATTAAGSNALDLFPAFRLFDSSERLAPNSAAHKARDCHRGGKFRERPSRQLRFI